MPRAKILHSSPPSNHPRKLCFPTPDSAPVLVSGTQRSNIYRASWYQIRGVLGAALGTTGNWVSCQLFQTGTVVCPIVETFIIHTSGNLFAHSSHTDTNDALYTPRLLHAFYLC